MSTALANALAPNIQRVPKTNLAEVIQLHTDSVRNRSYFELGFMMNIFFGVSDDSAYFQDPVNKHLGPITRRQGLQLDWNQNVYPKIAEVSLGGQRSEQFVFPRGIVEPPKISDPRYVRMNPADPPAPLIPQDPRHYASGAIYSRNNDEYLVLQPVTFIGIRTCGTLLRLVGRANRAGEYPAFLYCPKKKTGFLVKGTLTIEIS